MDATSPVMEDRQQQNGTTPEVTNGTRSGLGGVQAAAEPAARATGAPGSRTPAAFRLRTWVRHARAVLPALASGAVGGLLAESVSVALLLVGFTLVFSLRFARFGYPLDLMPASRLILALVAPLLGAGGFAAAVEAGLLRQPLSLPIATIAGLSGGLVAIAAYRLGDRLLSRRPIRLAVLGSPRFAVGLSRELVETGRDDVEFAGWLNLGGRLEGTGSLREQAMEGIRRAVVDHRIDLIVRGHGRGPGADYGATRPYESAAEACVDLPVRLIDGNQLYEELFGHVPMGTIDSAWYLYLMHPRFQATPERLKRAFDLAGALLAGLVGLPFVALAALAIKLEDRGPVFYRQRRVGESGREFEILKLRTMRLDAESAGPRWSAAGDSRVTRLGRVLRRLHVDELPQLFNVVRGEMTLVGPRPERPSIVAELEAHFDHYQRRHLVKPGVTGWAQVRCGYAASTLGVAWKVCHDLYYLKHRSLLADLLIMIETLSIAAKDAHRALRAPASQFLFGEELGLPMPGPRPSGAVPQLQSES